MEVEYKKFRDTNYIVSSNGIIINTKFGRKRELKKAIDKYGYERVQLYFGTHLSGKHFLVHRLVAECFLEKVEGKNDINHKDSNKVNNYYLNLEWCTTQENTAHFFKSENARIGDKCYQAKLKNEDVVKIKEHLKNGDKVGYIAKQFNTPKYTISKIKHGKKWSHI